LREVAIFTLAETRLIGAASLIYAWSASDHDALGMNLLSNFATATRRFMDLRPSSVPFPVLADITERVEAARIDIERCISQYRGAVRGVLVERVRALQLRLVAIMRQPPCGSAIILLVWISRKDKEMEMLLQEVDHVHWSMIFGLSQRVDRIEREIVDRQEVV
jgi:hypothetical protein